MLCNLYNSWIIISNIIFFSIQDVYAFSSYMHSVHTWTRDSREASNMDMRVLCQKR